MDNSLTDRRIGLMARAGIIGLAAVACMATLGCNTTEGVGEDIEAAGDAIDDAAEDAQN
jgi:predicted small secreted protein